jgi:hypothetical protein
MVRLIEGSAKCRHKKLTCEGPFQSESEVKYARRKSTHRLHGLIEWRGEVSEGEVPAGRREFFPPRIFQLVSPMSVPWSEPPPPPPPSNVDIRHIRLWIRRDLFGSAFDFLNLCLSWSGQNLTLNTVGPSKNGRNKAAATFYKGNTCNERWVLPYLKNCLNCTFFIL